ncbi:MAG: hypothetical protein J3Q66DRAFT_430945 [Benniella sp.]|nr:MAG: hypothetical protein J3Q66DRAFT_430945 [Benniella sp.]
MEATQSFRLAGGTDVEEISCSHVNGHLVVYWEDIESVFPEVKRIKCGNASVNLMRSPDEKRMEPYRIQYYPDVVLDIVISTSDGNEPTTVSPTNSSTSAKLQQQNLPSDDEGDTTLIPNQVVKYVPKDAIESNVEQPVVASPLSDSQSKALTSSTPDALVQAIKDGHLNRLGKQLIVRLQDLKDEVAKNNVLASKNNDLASKNNELASKNNELASKNNELASKNNELASKINNLVLENNQVGYENKELLIRLNDLQKVLDSKQDEMKQLQIQALDRLALIQNSVKALLTQTFELHEYPIPRLFIVLPDEKSSWNAIDFFSNKFRLYFLCECGEHTKTTNSKIPHHIHLAKHEGYDIDRPNEFFQQYGSYVLIILRMLKFGITVAGVAIPALSQLIRVDGLGQAMECLNSLTKTIEPGMDLVINHIDKASADDGEAVVGFSEQTGSNEALEGADLRQLEAFLKIKDSNRVLGNLYRTVTGEGHVKWVCLDHFRENYHAKAAQSFRDTVDSLQGTFDEITGRAEVRLQSRVQAEQFYRVLESAKSIYELKVELDWDTTQSDFKMLRNALSKTSVGVLELHLIQQDVPSRDLLSRSQPYDSILEIMRHPSIQSFTIRGSCDFTKRSSLLSRNYDFPNLRHLNISLDQLKDDTLAVKRLITQSSNLSSLALGSSDGYTQTSLGETVGDLIYPPTLRRLDIPLYNFQDDIPGVTRLISNATNLSSLTVRTDKLIAKGWAHSMAKVWDLCLPPRPPRESNQSTDAQQCLGHYLRYHCETNGPQGLDRNVLKLFSNKMDSLGGSSDEDIGRVEAILRSSTHAEHFYYALENARSVHELKVVLDWGSTQGDLEKLRDTLATTNVGVLELHLQRDKLTRTPLNCNQLYDPVLDIMQHQSIQSFTIRGPRDFSKQSSLLSRNEGFPNLLHLDVSLQELKDDIPGVMYLITKASNLSSLTIGTGILKRGCRYVLEAYNAISEHRTYPINFKDLNLVIPRRESNQSTATQQCMEQLLEFYCGNGSGTLHADRLDELTMDTLTKATENGLAFRTLDLGRDDQLGDSFVNDISSIVARFEFNNITIHTKEEEGRVRILESIQWKYLRNLTIGVKPGSFETRVMRVLVDGVKKMSQMVELESFEFWSGTWGVPLPPPERDLLQTFVASASFKQLILLVDMTLGQILSLMKLNDFSRLEKLVLWAKDFDSVQVDAIIDGVGHATKLRVLELEWANITVKQKSQMESKGITLKNYLKL